MECIYNTYKHDFNENLILCDTKFQVFVESFEGANIRQAFLWCIKQNQIIKKNFLHSVSILNVPLFLLAIVSNNQFTNQIYR